MPADRSSVAELLSPAGDWEALRAAVANGADAVYFGLSNFNARHRATNFSADELPAVMQYLHGHNVRGYLAFNTLIFSDELERAADFVQSAAKAGVDALIVQDLGLARLIHAMAPTLPIHGSTQMTLSEPRGIEFVHALGVQRVILARELSIAQIGAITAGTSVPVEVFVHGALCVAYSGQCLTSESLGGRSANRGQCAQACRLPYDLIVDGEFRDLGDKAYLLSPQDLAAHDLIGELLKLGVAAFKIEGRLKSAHYVAATTQTYRAALDVSLKGEAFAIPRQQEQDLAQSFSRGFTHGFLKGVNHQTLVHARFPKSRGVRVGTVVDRTQSGLVVEIDPAHTTRPPHAGRPIEVLKPGDGVVFDEGHPEQDEQGGRVFAVHPVKNRKSKVENLELQFHAGDVSLSAVALGSIVWRTDDPAIRRRLAQSFSRDTVAHRVALDFRVRAPLGGPLQLSACDGEGHEAAASWPGPLQRAEKFPLTPDLLRDQLGRLGQTPFELGRVELEAPDAVMAPKSVLNDLRRQVADALARQREVVHPVESPHALEELRHAGKGNPSNADAESVQGADRHAAARLTVLARTMDQLRAVLDWRDEEGGRPDLVYCDFEDIRRYKDAVALARAAGMPIGLATLRIVKPGEEGLLKQIADCRPDAVLVRNLAGLSYYSQVWPELPLLGDYSLNVANELTARIFAEAGLVRMVPSYDLNWRELATMLQRAPVEKFEVVIHQHMPMFHMEHCVFAHTLSDGSDYRTCGRPCEGHRVDLRDRVGQAHPLLADVGCRNTLFNAAAQTAAEYVPEMKRLGLRHYRVELLRESPQEACGLLDRYARVLAGREDARTAIRRLRVLNQLGVTRGTLDYI